MRFLFKLSISLFLPFSMLTVMNLAKAASLENMGAQTSDAHIVWRRAPIQITLPVGKERFVTFPAPVQFGYPVNLLPPDKLRVENDNRTIYFLAKQAFQTVRAEAKLEDGEVILLNINAKPGAADWPIDISLPDKMYNQNADGLSTASKSSLNEVTLTRFAIQQLYAPKRFLKPSAQITRYPMATKHVVPLLNDGSLLAMPLASWRGGAWYVTAVMIKNLLPQSLKLDPRLLCGNFQAASFYPRTILRAHGSRFGSDSTTVFLVSSQPFSQAMKVCLY